MIYKSKFNIEILLFLLSMIFPSLAYPSWVGVASALQGYQDAERQRLADENRRIQAERDRLQFEREKQDYEQAKERSKKAEQEREQQEKDNLIAQQVQSEIDKNPTLKNWQTTDSKKWLRAVEYDDYLRSLDEYKNVSMKERFAQVAKDMSIVFSKEDRTDKRAPSNEWSFISLTGGDDRAFFYVNRKTITATKSNKSLRSSWVLTNYVKNKDVSSNPYNTTKSIWNFDCKAKSYGVKQTIFYKDNDVSYTGISTEHPKLEDAVPESAGEFVLMHVCGKRI